MVKRYNETIVKVAWDYKDRKIPKEIIRILAYVYSVRYDRIKHDLKKATDAFEED